MNDFEIIEQPAVEYRAKLDLTVVVPTSNTAAYLPACLNSLSSQGDLRMELIVVDFRSVDDSLEVVRDFCRRHPWIPLTVVKQNVSGLGDARNVGLDLASGEFIAFLDSDDFYMPASYAAMVTYARAHHCDLVFARAMVFDDFSQSTQHFYDDWVMTDILGGRESLTTTVLQEPRLFKLEPNASIRIMRRNFMLERDIRYSARRRAEDLVPHCRSLFEAECIGLLSRRCFFYRTGRAGKLTSDPSKWIGDLKEAVASVLSEANHYRPSSAVGAALIYACARSMFGYGSNLPYADRLGYYRSASLLMAQVPEAWMTEALARPMHSDAAENIRIKVAVAALARQNAAFLVYWSGRSRSLIGLALRLIFSPGPILPVFKQYWRVVFTKRGWALIRKAAHV